MTTPRVSHGLSLAITTAFLPLYSGAATTPQFWNPGATGGDGVWGTGPADTSWNTAVGAATPNYAWPDTAGSVATFQDNVGGTATIFGQVSATGVQQNGAGYTIEGGTLRLITGSGGEQPFIAVQTGTLNITATVAGTAGLTKTGAGILSLSGFNTFTGPTSVDGGILLLSGPNQLPDGGALTISAGSSVSLAGGNETVASLVSNGGSVGGAGTLTAATYQLNNGTNISTNLGTGILNTSGSVVLGGSSAAGTVNVNGGVLSINGNALADTAIMTLNAGGQISLGSGADTVAALISNGGSVIGAGTLSAATYALNSGSSVGGHLGNGAITTNGVVTITGTTGTGSLSVASGTLHFMGSSGAGTVQIATGADLRDDGNLADAASLTNAGSLTMLGSDTIGQYFSNGGTLSGPGTLSAASYLLENGSSVSGHLGGGVLSSNGAVSISGSAAAATVDVDSGILSLAGGNLIDSAAVHLAGGAELMLGGADSIGALVSDGGIVSGSGTLTASNYLLNDGTQITGSLGSGALDSHGNVESSGTIGASTIRIVDGSLLNTGMLGSSATWIDIGGNASLAAGGTQHFARLTTAAGAVGTWAGNLAGAGTIAPGGDAAAGTLRVLGDFAPTGTLSLDAGAAGHDLVQVTGNANFGGVLQIDRLGAGDIEAMVPLQVVQAATYSGTFSALQENLDGVVFFNPANGSLTRLGFGDGAAFLGRATPNQASTWIALYDDVIDPGTRNAFYRPGQRPPYELSSGIASSAAPDLLAALGASLGPAGLDAALLNRLSPEAYGSLSDYSLQALRNHHLSARKAPALVAGGQQQAPVAPSSAKDGRDAKGAEITAPSASGPVWEVFAAADYFDTGTDGSLSQGDYDLSGAGVIAGGRFSPNNRLRFSAWLAGDDGQIDGSLIDADAKGFALGLDSEAFIPAGKREVRLSAGISYGSWEFDGSRGSASASTSGWAPGFSSFPDADADAFDAFVSIDSVVWRTETFRLTPSFGLAYSNAASDAFRELQGGPGSAIALAVDGAGRDSLAAQLGLAAEADLNRFITLDGETGVQVALNEDTERISGRFVSGSRPMSAILSPLSDDLFYLGGGATWHANERCQLRLGYRAEFRSDADPLNAVSLSGAYRF